MRSPLFHAVTRVEQNRTVIRLSGELDISTVPRLERAVGQALGAKAPVVVLDLRDLQFVDVVGLKGIELLTQGHAGVGRTLTVTNLSEPVMRLLDVIGVHDLTITS